MDAENRNDEVPGPCVERGYGAPWLAQRMAAETRRREPERPTYLDGIGRSSANDSNQG
ncbi:hypothetical protein sos41_34930 [Alphaproteobacteria bacterium SO-S41]|nr:hypothetical protein sos41_34930 [Alphaproteobacteria bacterium SO-S41]